MSSPSSTNDSSHLAHKSTESTEIVSRSDQKKKQKSKTMSKMLKPEAEMMPIPRPETPLAIPDAATLSFFSKRSFVCPSKIRATNIRNMMKQKPVFKLSLGPEIQEPAPVKFDDNVPYIFRIPEKYISCEERTKTLQYVCRQISTEVRLRVGIQSFLDETTRNGPTFMRDMIVDSVIVGKYTSPLVSPKNLLIHPKNVREFEFLEPICLQHLDAFLTRCSRLKKLSIRNHVVRSLAPSTLAGRESREFEWRAVETIQKYPIKIPSLRELTIIMAGPGRALVALPLILELICPKFLRRLSIRIEGGITAADTKKIHFLVINFIKDMDKLTHILLSTAQNDNYEWKSCNYFGFPHDQLMAMGQAMKLQQMILTETCVEFHTWCPIMVVQKCLEVFQVLHIMSWAIPQEIILRNASTLRKIAIHVILWANAIQHTPLNLGIFSKCVCLTELYICIGAPFKPGHIDVYNFYKLPSSLDTFLLKDGTYYTEDFENIAKTLPNLVTLGVCLKCKHDDCGPTSGSIQKFLRMRKLNELFISQYQFLELKDEIFGDKKLFLAALASIGGRIKSKPRTIHIREKPCRWVARKGEYACTLDPEWGI